MKISKSVSRLFSLLLAVIMIVGMLPLSAFAAANDTVTGKTFTEASTLEDGETYVIVSTNTDNDTMALDLTEATWSGSGYQYDGFAGTEVSISGDNITSDVKEAMLWQINIVGGKYTVKNVSEGKYLKGTYTGKTGTLSLSEDAFSWTLSSNKFTFEDGSNTTRGISNDDSANRFDHFTARSEGSCTELTFYKVTNATSGGEGGGEGGSTNPPAQTENLTKVDTLTDGKYIIVSTGRALDLDVADTYNRSSYGSSYKYDGFNGKAVTVSGNKITGTVYQDMVWEVKSVSGGYTIKSSYATGSDVYLSGSYVNNYGLLELSSDAAVWTYSNSILGTGGKYIANNDDAFKFFTMRSTGTDVAFYAVTDESGFLAPTYGGQGGGSTETQTIEITTNNSAASATEDVSIAVGESFVLELTNGSSADKTHAISNTNSSVASVDASNNFSIAGNDKKEITITGLKEGSTTITFTGTSSRGSTYYAVVNVTVGTGEGGGQGGGSTETVEITATSSGATANATIAVGETLIVELTNSSSHNAKTFSGESANPAIATVESGSKNIAGGATGDFEVQGVAAGNTTITFTGTGSGSTYTATINLTVTGEGGEGGNGGEGGSGASDKIVVIAGSDYQANNSSTTVRTILGQIKEDYTTAYGFLFGGDYSAGMPSSNSDMTNLDNDVSAVYSGIAANKRIYVQGNHDSGSGYTKMTTTGAHDTDYYGVYAINEDDFSSNGNSNSTASTANALKTYLDAKVAAGYKKPIFVVTHLPLHVTSRNDNNGAANIFNALNAAGASGLNIIFLFGHNHSGGYDAYLGNGSIYLPKGSSINVAGGSNNQTLNFTYMNCGYVGYVNGSSSTALTMTAFEINDTQVIVKRYSTSGTVNLKAAGSGNNANTSVVASPATITLTTPSAHTHNYGTPVITWAANGQTATVTVTCSASGCPEKTVTANVTATPTGSTAGDCETRATTTYTIPAGTIAGKSYASANTVVNGDYGSHNYGTLVSAQAEVHTPTELKASVAAHYQCSVCDKYFTEGKVETTLQALTGTTPSHSYGTAWTTDADQHWHECSCGAKQGAADHSYNATTHLCECGVQDPTYVPHTHNYGTPVITWAANGQTATVTVTCSASGCPEKTVTANVTATPTGSTAGDCETRATTTYTIPAGTIAGKSYASANTVVNGDYGSHNYGTLIPAQAEKHTPTELTASVAAHYQCSICEKYFTEGKVETTLEDLKGTVPSHSYGTAWENDDDQHWHECSCGAKQGTADHAYTNGVCVCGAEDPDYEPTEKLYLIVSNGYALTSNPGTSYQNNGSSSSQKYNYYGFEGEPYTAGMTATADMLWSIVETSGGIYIMQDGKYLNGTYTSNSTGGNDGTLKLDATRDVWVEDGDLLKSTNASGNSSSDKYLTHGNGTNANVNLFSVRSESSATDVEFIEYTGSAPAPAKTLESIAVTTNPTKMTYTAGENFNRAGMVVTATYSDNTTAPVTEYEVSGGTNMAAGSRNITISYAEGGVSRTTTLTVTVNAAQTPDEEEGNPTKVTSTTLADGQYIIAVGTKALTSEKSKSYTNSYDYTYSGFNAADITVSGNEITAGATEDMVFEIKAVSGGYSIKHVDSGKYLYATYTDNSGNDGWTGTLTLETTADTWSLNSSWQLKSAKASDNTDRKDMFFTYDDKENNGATGNFFGIRSSSNADAIDFYLVGKALEDDDDNQGGGNQGGNEGGNQGGNEGGEVTDTPTKVTSLEAGSYILVANGKALTNEVHNGYTNSSDYSYKGFAGGNVTIVGDEITKGATDAMIFEVKAEGNGYTIMQNGKYLSATYTQNSNNSAYTGTLTLSATQDVWTWDASTGYLKSTNASTSSKGLYLVFDDVNNNVSSGTQDNLFGIRSDGNSGNNLDRVDFYRVGEVKDVKSIAVTKAPNKTAYYAGQSFDSTGMVITATYEDNTTGAVTGYTVTNGTNLTVGQTSVTISYRGATTTQTIAVTARDTSGEVYLAFTSDVHNQSNNTSANRLNTWLNNVSDTINDTFQVLGSSGDMADAGTSESNYWTYAQKVMDVVTSNSNVDEGFYVAGNHEHSPGNVTGNTSAAAQNIKAIGATKVTNDYALYSFGAAGSNQTFNTSDINNLNTWLNNNATGANADKPVFVISHFPIHYYNNRTTSNAAALADVLNDYPNVIFLWGHNHTLSDTHYDNVHEAGDSLQLTNSSSNTVEINFTYAASGCMSDSEYSGGSASVDGKGLVAEILDGAVVLTYYNENGTAVSQPVTIVLGSVDEEHTHRLTHVEAKESTCTEAGNVEYWNCSICGKNFSDEAGTTEIADVATELKEHEVVAQLPVEATCTETGLTAGSYCSVCETVLEEQEVVPMKDHDFGQDNTNETCSVCGAENPNAPVEKFDIAGTNMTLGNSLAMNFFIDPANLDADESYYAIITKAYANGADQDFIVDQTKWNQLDGGSDALLYVTLDVVAAKEMTDDVTVVIYNSKDEAVSNVYTDSVRAYTMRALEKEEAAESPNKAKLTMYVDMLNYGAAAQVRFEYDVNDLANSQLNEDQKDYATGSVIMVNQQEKGEGYVGMNLTLESNLLMNFFFNNIPDSHNDMYAIATFTNHYGEPVEVRIEGEEFGQLKNDTKWYVPVTGVVVADCSQLVTVKVYNANDTVVASGVDSIESYIARAMEKDPQLYDAIMKFAVSAKAALRRN